MKVRTSANGHALRHVEVRHSAESHLNGLERAVHSLNTYVVNGHNGLFLNAVRLNGHGTLKGGICNFVCEPNE
jgi:hypothetical protein